jgi:ribosomal protein L11 methyltransferase
LKNYSILLSGPTKNWDEWVQTLSDFEGFLGLLELPDESHTTFLPAKGFEVLEFGSEAAKRCLEWMERDFERTGDRRFARIYFSRIDYVDEKIVRQELESLEPELVVLSLQEEADRDYQEEFRKNFKGSLAGKKFWLGPPWDQPPTDRKPIYLEPGMAFGTGDHPTTQLCVGLLEDFSRQPETILDLGTGTGVLAVAARILFPRARIWASDLDPQCREDFSKTLSMNRLSPEEFITAFGPAADLHRLKSGLLKLDLLVTNIYAEVLLGLLTPIKELLPIGASWIVSGILEKESGQSFIEEVQASGFEVVEKRSLKKSRPYFEKTQGLSQEEETWLGLHLKRKGA